MTPKSSGLERAHARLSVAVLQAIADSEPRLDADTVEGSRVLFLPPGTSIASPAT